MNEKIEKIRHMIKEDLDTKRYNHTLGVMYTAAALAMCHGASLEKAMIAGLLHDCAKGVSNDKKIGLCKKYNIEVSETERKNPGLLHAKLGAYFSWKRYQIDDKEILSAIVCHTTGKPNMSLLDKIVYIADYIEPERRELPNMTEVRALAFHDIDACLCRILEDSLVYLKRKNMVTDIMTEKTYKYYKDLCKQEEK